MGPAVVVSFEPNGSFARVLAGQQPGQPGGPDVGEVERGRGCGGQCGTRGVGRWGLPRVYEVPGQPRYGPVSSGRV